MNKLNILKALKNNRLRICMAFALALMMAFLPAFNINTLTEIMVLAEEYGETYEGETTANVRVRSGAGTDNSVLLDSNGDEVLLKSGTKIEIIGEEKASNGGLWYHVSFEYDGKAMDGYSFGEYIEKSSSPKVKEIVATPTPEPTPTSVPTLSPTPSPTPTPVAVETDSEAAEQVDNSIAKYAIIVAVLAAAFIVFLVLYLVFVKNKGQEGTPSAKNSAKKLKKLTDEASKSGKERDKERKSRVSYEDEDEEDSPKLQDGVYVKKKPAVKKKQNNNPNSEYLYVGKVANPEMTEEEKQREAEYRAEIDGLREHDLIIHKYFGRGEVFDNNDVRLMEVHFGQDTRFLNKETIIREHLVRVITDDSTLRYRRRP